tara:strand:+ start:175 stop:567 length:393 start_codon:yes stop_codon:yes gene_type:complete
LNIRIKYIIICFLTQQSVFSQNKGELTGFKRKSSFQNYSLSQNNTQIFEGLSSIQILRQEALNKRNQAMALKEIEQMHLEKQDKPTRKRMKSTLKMSQKWLANKPIVRKRKVIKQRKIILGQKKLIKEDE